MSVFVVIAICLALLVLVGLFFFVKKIFVRSQPLLTSGLHKPKEGFIAPLKQLLSGPGADVKNILSHLEETLLLADVGIETTSWLLDQLAREPGIKSGDQAYAFIQQKITQALTPTAPLVLGESKPQVFFIVGVNGTGKTTSIGKLAAYYIKQGRKVLLVAADTFRAAAMDQLKIWADRTGADFVGGASQADPASVVYNGIKAARARQVDVVLVDTAGRLHNKVALMEELKKMARVLSKELGRSPDQTLLILDATTGQNGLAQVKSFKEAVPVTGIILTKYDGTSKGGVIVAASRETSLPIRFVGVGEQTQDLKPFDPTSFVGDLFS